MIIMILFFLIFYVNTVSSTNNTTQLGNFTVEWVDFNLLTCAVPTTINISLFTCIPSAVYTQVNDTSCLQETTIDFDQNICLPATTAGVYTNTAPTTQYVTKVTTTPIQTSKSTTAAATTQSITADIISHASITTGTNFTSTTTTAVITHTSTTNSATNHVSTAAPITGYGSINTTTTTTITSVDTTIATAADTYSCPNEDYIGTYCNISSDACAMSQPCLNAATCFPNHTLPYGYSCQCQTGYTGYNCENDERACMENTCWNDGTCVPINSTVASNNGSNFRCECTEGYNGVYCELKIDLCGNITCANKGICSTFDLMWKCLCLDSSLYYGDYCQFKTSKLKIREILSKSFASVAIGAIIATCTFVIVMDILKYAFHIDPVECERESYRQRLEAQRRARRPIRDDGLKLALRFKYVS